MMAARPLLALLLAKAATAQVQRHIGAACGADSPCPSGMFCNFDGDPFCEACLDCGSPDDDWAGCTDCGLPGAGAADCTASCNADPDIIAANQWKVANGGQIDDHWVLAEVAMFTDRGCTVPATPSSMAFSSMAYGDACESPDSCSILNDGVCDTEPGCCDVGGTQWAGNDNAAAKAPGGTFVTYVFDAPVAIQCVQICHSEAAHQQMLDVLLQYSGDDGATFTTFDILAFPEAEGTIGGEVGSCSTTNPCPFGGFCNFDGGDSGRCEACGDCGGPDVGMCNDCGLPQAGADDCVSACTPPPPPTRHIGAACTADSPCPGGMFCNFDGGESGFCEMCTDCGESADNWAGCTDCGLPGAGAADCTASCQADPDMLTAPMWRVTNGLPIGDHWIISEITMFADRDCSMDLAPAGIMVSSMSYGDACASSDIAADGTIDCPLFTDGVLDSSPHCCDAYPSGTQWAGNDDAAAKAPGGTWVAYSFPQAETVQCITIVHSEADHQSMTNVMLQYSTDGVEWTTFDVLEFESSPGAEVGGCSIYDPCPSGSFCNFDDGNSGRCEPCGDCGGPDPAECNACGLPQAGADNCVDVCGASPTGQHGSHTGAYCDTDSTCPPGMFCNFDGEERGVDGFCEMCLDCGEPGDSWAGCTSCGLPDEGASDCTASCNANPNEISSNEWRITNGATIGDHWIISEVELYADRDCSVLLEPISIAVSSMDYGVACGGSGTMAADGTVECPLFTDGTCDTSPHCCNAGGSQWAGGDSAADQAPEGTWVAYRFAEPTTVGCVQMCHSEASHQQMTTVLLQYTSDAGMNWGTYDVLEFEASGGGDTTASAGCSVENPCPGGAFCNFDGGDSGACELCGDCEGPSGCYDCGLPTAGGDDCMAQCGPGGMGGEYCTTAGPCADGFFCNFDGGTTGICEACDDCDGYNGGCGDCGLPGEGAADCAAMCVAGGSSSVSQGTPGVTMVMADGVAGMTTYRLTYTLSASASNLYALAGTSTLPLSMPAAYQASVSADVAGVSPVLFATSPDSEFDSWLTVGITDGSDGLSTVGMDFSSWSTDSGLSTEDGLVFTTVPDAGPSGTVVVAQLTIPTGSSATATAMLQGRSVGFMSGPGYDWVEAASWSIGSGGAVAQPTCFYDGDGSGMVTVDDLLGLLSEYGRDC